MAGRTEPYSKAFETDGIGTKCCARRARALVCTNRWEGARSGCIGVVPYA